MRIHEASVHSSRTYSLKGQNAPRSSEDFHLMVYQTSKSKDCLSKFKNIPQNRRRSLDNDSHQENVSGKYNPRNCTFEEFCSTIETFAKEGMLTDRDVLLGTANFERSLRQVSPDSRFYITKPDSSGRRNWIEEFGALAERELLEGNLLGYTNHTERKRIALRAYVLYSQISYILY